jgi:hypothetical protein
MRTLLLAVLAAALFAAPSPAVAATCADHATQAEAQSAADTRDADGDGVYCVISPR